MILCILSRCTLAILCPPVAPILPVYQMTDSLTRQRRAQLMSRVRTRDTAPERSLRRAMWRAGIRGWRLHSRRLPGRPDIAFGKLRVAVFVDGAFWHGHPAYYHGQSGEFWDQKIAANRARDLRVNAELAALGWAVLRIWDFEIEEDADACARRVRALLSKRTGAASHCAVGARS